MEAKRWMRMLPGGLIGDTDKGYPFITMDPLEAYLYAEEPIDGGIPVIVTIEVDPEWKGAKHG